MRTIVISCDRCSKEIKGYPVKIIPGYTGREDNDILPDGIPFPDWGEEILVKDYCEQCAEKIVRYAFGGMKKNPEFEKAVEDMMKNAAPPHTHNESGERGQEYGCRHSSRRKIRKEKDRHGQGNGAYKSRMVCRQDRR